MTAGILFFNLPIILAIILTIIVEFIVYLIAIRQNVWKILWYCFLINLLTVPLVNFFYLLFYTEKSFLFLIIEMIAIVVEFALIMWLFKNKWWKALIISLIANLASLIGGFFIYIWFFG